MNSIIYKHAVEHKRGRWPEAREEDVRLFFEQSDPEGGRCLRAVVMDMNPPTRRPCGSTVPSGASSACDGEDARSVQDTVDGRRTWHVDDSASLKLVMEGPDRPPDAGTSCLSGRRAGHPDDLCLLQGGKVVAVGCFAGGPAASQLDKTAAPLADPRHGTGLAGGRWHHSRSHQTARRMARARMACRCSTLPARQKRSGTRRSFQTRR